MLRYWVSQILALAAYLLLGFGLRKEKKIELLQYSTIYQGLMLVHYLLLNGYLGMISCVVGIIRNFVFINNEHKHKENSRSILIIFCIITLSLTGVFFNDFVDIFPCILTIVGIFIYWCTDMKVIRIGNIGVSICYIIYAISLNSWFSIVCEGYLIVSTIIGYIKYEAREQLID